MYLKILSTAIILNILFSASTHAQNNNSPTDLQNSSTQNIVYDFTELSDLQKLKLKKELSVDENTIVSKIQANEIIKFLFKSKLYQEVSIEETNSTYKVKVKLTPVIHKIKINTDLDPFFVNSKLDIKEGDNLDQQKIRDSLQDIKKTLSEQAFFNPQLDFELKTIAQGKFELELNIYRGEQIKIQSLSFVSENKKLLNSLKDIEKNYTGRAFNEKTKDELYLELKEFFSERFYYNTSVSEPEFEFANQQKNVNISFKIINPYSLKIKFHSNYNISDSELLRSLNLRDNLFSNASNPLADIRERIKDYYKLQAFAFVQVNSKEEIDEKKFQKTYIFDITENKKIKISNIELRGQYSYPKSYYRNWLEDNGADLIKNGYYHSQQLQTSLEQMLVFLQDQGYLRAKLDSLRTELNASEDAIDIYIDITEGPLSILEEIHFIGAKNFKKEELLKITGLSEGKALQLSKIEPGIQKLLEHYEANAFLEVKVEEDLKSRIEYNSNFTKAKLNIKVYEGDKIMVDSIQVQGLQKTKPEIILKAIEFSHGDYLSTEKILESEASLQRLGLFRSISIKQLPGFGSKRNIAIFVQERNPGTLTFGMGVTNENKLSLRGYTGFIYRNLLGTAKTFSTRLELKSKVYEDNFLEHKFNASYIEPFIFDTKTKGRIDASRSQQLFADEDDTAILINEVDFSVENNLTRYFKVEYKVWGIATSEKYVISDRSQSEEIQIASTGPGLEWDYRDNAFLPRDGTYTKINFEYSSPDIGSSESVHYGKSILNFNHYLPIDKTKSWVFAYSVRGGYIDNFGKDAEDAVPQEKMFFLGGRSSIRGYQYNSIPDFDLLKEDPDDSFVSLKTSSSFYLTKFELRFPIQDNFGGLFFYDGGAVHIAGVDLEKNYHHSVGIAFQYNSPIGAISLGYGHKLDRAENDLSPGEIFFSIGDF